MAVSLQKQMKRNTHGLKGLGYRSCSIAAGEHEDFVRAVEAYRRVNSRKFPTLSEMFWIIKKLGYRKGCLFKQTGSHCMRGRPVDAAV